MSAFGLARPLAGPRSARGPARSERRVSSWRRIASGVGTTLAVLAVAVATLALVLSIATQFSPRRQDGQYVVFSHPTMVVLSGSMTPTFRGGDLIIDDQISRVGATRLRVGQVISFHPPSDSSKVITHRIVAVTKTASGAVAYRTKGDANNAADSELVPAMAVVGRYHTRIPFGGYVLNALHRPLVLALLATSLLLWLFVGPLWRMAHAVGRAEPSLTQIAWRAPPSWR